MNWKIKTFSVWHVSYWRKKKLKADKLISLWCVSQKKMLMLLLKRQIQPSDSKLLCAWWHSAFIRCDLWLCAVAHNFMIISIFFYIKKNHFHLEIATSRIANNWWIKLVFFLFNTQIEKWVATEISAFLYWWHRIERFLLVLS